MSIEGYVQGGLLNKQTPTIQGSHLEIYESVVCDVVHTTSQKWQRHYLNNSNQANRYKRLAKYSLERDRGKDSLLVKVPPTNERWNTENPRIKVMMLTMTCVFWKLP